MVSCHYNNVLEDEEKLEIRVAVNDYVVNSLRYLS